MKEVFSFIVNLEQEVEKTEVRNENGQEITVKTKVKEEIPHKIVMKKPTRSEQDELRLFHGAQFKRAIDAGLLTNAILVTKHIDGAGALLSKETQKRLSDLYESIDKYRNELMLIGATEKDETEKQQKQEKVLMQYLEAQRELQAIEGSNQSLKFNTAEFYAQEKANMWLILNQTYIDKNGKVVPMFSGNNFTEKEKSLVALEDNDDTLLTKISDELALCWSLYLTNEASKPEEFQAQLDKFRKSVQANIEDKKEEVVESVAS